MDSATLKQAIREAQESAYEAADHYFKTQLKGVDQMCCGFAWVDILEHDGRKIRGNSRLGKMLKEAGVRQSYTRAFQIWDPSRYPAQNVDTLEAGARAAADTLKKYGFTAYAGSRLD